MSLIPYALTRPFLFGLDPEAAHELTLGSIARLQNTPAQCLWSQSRTDDPVTVAGLRFPNRVGLAAGVDDFEHTGLSSAPEYPADIVEAIAARTASMAKGPLWWTPTIEGLWNYEYVRDHREGLDDPAWKEGLQPDTIADVEGSIQHPEQLSYFQLTPLRKPTLATKFGQLRRAGVVMLVGTDSGIPLKFHSRSTWNEIDVWTRELGVPAMQAIRAATYWPAVAMKVDQDYGTLTPGKWADVIAVRGDVLRYPALLQNVPFVMQHGKVVKDERVAASR